MMKKLILVTALAVSFSTHAASDIDVLRKNMEAQKNEALAYSNQINKRAVMNSKNITDLQIKKVDKTVYDAGQARQDKELAEETVARIEGDKRNDKALAGKVDNTTYLGDQTKVNTRLNNLDTNIGAESQERVEGDHLLSGRIDSTNAVLGSEADTRLEADNKLSDRITTKVDTSAYHSDKTTQKAVNNSVQDSLGSKVSSQVFYEAQNNQGAINNQLAYNNAVTNRRIDNTDATIANLAEHSNKEFRRLGREIDNNKKRADAGIAGVAAMASIPPLVNGQHFNVGAGIGNRGGQQALAVGASAAVTDRTTVKLSVAADTEHSFTAGAGVAYGW